MAVTSASGKIEASNHVSPELTAQNSLSVIKQP